MPNVGYQKDIKQMTTPENVRVLGRQVARELTREEIDMVSGGRNTNCNTSMQCIQNDDFIDIPPTFG